jgi:signal transduction histidine kinase
VARRVPILAKLLAAYLVPAVATFAGFGLVAHYVARHALEDELGRRLTAIAAAAAAQIADENIALLAPGDEQTRTYRNVQRRLGELAGAAGAARIYVFAADHTSRCDTRPGVPVGERYYTLDASQSELRQVFAGTPAASFLFRGRDGQLYKSGFAPLRDDSGRIPFAVGVDGAASLYAQLAGFRRSLVALGIAGALAIVVLSVVVARWLVRPVRLLARAADRMGRGELDDPVAATSRDEVGLVAETMEQMRQQLRARDERMQMMLAGIAHEVRNPLGGVELYAGLLREDLAADPAHAGNAEKLQHVLRIERELQRLKTIVNDFLEYARRPKPNLESCDVAELLGEVRDIALAAAQPRHVQVQLHAEPARVSGDEGQLRRALVNLAHNAVQACPDDGSGEVTLSCARAAGEVVVTIRDTGAGIAPDTLAKIWTPFYTTKQSGTGLGLAFVRDIARDHGARLAVDSSPGQGTTFVLALPEAS